DAFSRQCRDIKTNALELAKRAEADRDDGFWLSSSIAAFGTVWYAAGRNDAQPAAVGLALLAKLGWIEGVLMSVRDRLAALPSQATTAPLSSVKQFDPTAQRRRRFVA